MICRSVFVLFCCDAVVDDDNNAALAERAI